MAVEIVVTESLGAFRNVARLIFLLLSVESMHENAER